MEVKKSEKGLSLKFLKKQGLIRNQNEKDRKSWNYN